MIVENIETTSKRELTLVIPEAPELAGQGGESRAGSPSEPAESEALYQSVRIMGERQSRDTT
jgi:hypothetical protein